MFHLLERRGRSHETTRCSLQFFIVLGVCIVSTIDALSFPKQFRARNSGFPGSLHRQAFSNLNKGHSNLLLLRGKSYDEEEDEWSSPTQFRLPALGPAGTSSANKSIDNATSADNLADVAPIASPKDNKRKMKVPDFVNPKFALQYTCKVCETKNRVMVSRQAYRNGMVIAVCKGCKSKHWVANNIDPRVPFRNIEESMGEAVNRVTEEVFDIERIWGLQDDRITGESDDFVLE